MAKKYKNTKQHFHHFYSIAVDFSESELACGEYRNFTLAGSLSPGHRGVCGGLVKIACDELWQKLCFLWLPQLQLPGTCVCSQFC